MSNAGGIKAGLAYVEIGANDTELQKTLRRLERDFNSTANTIRHIGQTLAIAGVAIGAPMLFAAVQAGALGSALSEVSTQAGIAVESISALQFVADQTGSSLEGVSKGIKGMLKTLNDAKRGSSDATKSLASLGLSISDLDDLSPDQQFKVFAERIASISDPAERAAAATDLFGKAGFELLPLLSKGAAGIAEMENRFNSLGGGAAAQAAYEVREFGDAAIDTRVQLQAIRTEIGAAIAQALLPYRQSVADILKGVIDWISRNKDLIVTLGEVALKVAAVGTAIIGVAAALKGIALASGVFAAFAAPEALAFFAALSLVLVAITKAIEKLGIAVGQTEVDMGGFQAATLESFKASDAARKSYIAQAQALQAFADKPVKTQADVKGAADTVRELESVYGPLGISINETTGEITGLNEGLEELYFQMGQVKKAQLDQAMDNVSTRIGDIKLKLADVNLPKAERERLLKVKEKLDQEFDAMFQDRSRVELGERGFGTDAVFTPEDLPVTPKNESLLPKDQAEVDQAKARVQDLKREFRELAGQNPFEGKSSIDEELAKVEEIAKKKQDIANEILGKEFIAFGPMGPDNVSPWKNYSDRLAQIEKDRIEQTNSVERKHAEDIYQYRLGLELDLARASGDKARQAAIQAEQFIREQAKQIDELGLTGQVRSDAFAQVGDIAEKMLDVQNQIKNTTSSAGALNTNAIFTLNRSGGDQKLFIENQKKQITLTEQMRDSLRRLEAKDGLAFGA